MLIKVSKDNKLTLNVVDQGKWWRVGKRASGRVKTIVKKLVEVRLNLSAGPQSSTTTRRVAMWYRGGLLRLSDLPQESFRKISKAC